MQQRSVRTVAELVRRFGGPTALARALGISPNAVSNWTAAGEVPERWHARLLALAVQRKVDWRPPDWPPDVQLRCRPELTA